MTTTTPSLADLIGSRICHDLISPIGAISNGVELINMSGSLSGPEMNLISESVENANARIRFFRIAFGSAGRDQRIGRAEITSILADMSRGGRLVTEWQTAVDLPRPMVKLAFLVLQCLDHALPWGGRVNVNSVGDNWAILGEADQLRFDQKTWSLLTESADASGLQASNVQFSLAAITAAELGRDLLVEHSDKAIRVRF